MPAATLEAVEWRTAGSLTAREKEVLRLFATGLGTEALAERLQISPVTVRNHAQRILAKLGAHSRLEAVARGFTLGLIAPQHISES